MILTLTPNPALDLTWRVPRLLPGESHRITTSTRRAGGKGINVARVLHNEGVDVLALSTRARVGGDEFEADLEAARLPHRLLPVRGVLRRSVTVVDEASGEATVLNEAGQAPSENEWRDLVAGCATVLPSATALVVSGSLPGGSRSDYVLEVIRAAVELGCPTVVDASGDLLLGAAKAGASLLKPNRSELAATVNTDDPIEGAHRLLELGAGSVVVSLGEQGLLAVGAGRPHTPLALRDGDPLQARLDATLEGNPTGAGDAAVAALALGITAGDDRATLLRRAVAWSAAAVLAPVAGELHPTHPHLLDRVLFT